MTVPEQYDAIVIGAGQAGDPLARALAQSGRTTALIEREQIGGACINEGCTPTKTMIASGRVAYKETTAHEMLGLAAINLEFGISYWLMREHGDRRLLDSPEQTV